LPNIVFMGTPEFAVPSMDALLKAGYNIPLLVCQPDKKKGRGQKLQFPPTKEFALQNNIEVFQPTRLKDSASIDKIASFNPDFCVVIAYGRILPKEILELPKKGCINLHASLLPAWRGAAPIQFSLLNGDTKTGVCTMLIDEGMDTGDLLRTHETDVGPHECVAELTQRLIKIGADLVVETIRGFDSIQPVQQDHDKATYARLLTKEDRYINWSKNAAEIYCQYRAFSPSPGVVTGFRGKRLTIKKMDWVEDNGDSASAAPGTILTIDKSGFTVACGQGKISILNCQPESKKAIPAKDFVNGYQVKTGEILTDL